MRAVLAQMDLDDALLRFDKMPLSLTQEEKQSKDRNTLSQIHLHMSKANSTRRSKRENRHCIMVKVGEIVYDEKFN